MCDVIEFSVVIYNIKVTFIKHEFSWLFKFDANFSAYSFKEHICKESVTHERNNDLNKWKTTNVRIISHRTLHLGQSLKMCKYYCRKHILSHFLTKNMPTVAGVLWYPLHWIHQIHVWGFNTRIFKKLNWIVWRKNWKQLRFFQHQFVITSSLYWLSYSATKLFPNRKDRHKPIFERHLSIVFLVTIVFYSVLHKTNVKLNVFQNKTFFTHRVFRISEVFPLLPKQCISRLYVGTKVSHSKSTSV